VTCFGFRTGTLRGMTIEQAAAALAGLGFDCLELCLEAPDVRPELLDQTRCGEIRRTLDALGIKLASASYHADREPLEQRAANQERAIQVTRWLGADILVINPEKATDRDRQWRGHVAHLKKLCQAAQDVQVTLAMEPEPLLVVGSSQDMMAMMAEVGSPWLKVNLDIGHAKITDDDPAQSIRELGSAIVHLHLEDIQGRVHRHLPFGEGDIDFAAIRSALADIGYAGPYVVDLFGLNQDPRDVAATALEGLRRLFPSASESQAPRNPNR
jgi:sugar phosphate isomerase/epimerase